MPINKLLSDAKSHFNKGDYRSAMMVCKNLLEIDSNNIDGLYMTSSILIHSKKFELAINILNKLIFLTNNNSVFYYNLALAYIGINNFEQAEDNYKLAIKYDQNSIPALVNLGNLYQQQEKYEKSIIQYSKANKVNSNDEKIYNNIGLSYFGMKLYEKSIEHYKKALNINPKYEEAIFGLGNCYDNLGNSSQAVKFFKDVIFLNPEHARAIFNLSQTQLAMSDFYNGWNNYEWRFNKEIPTGSNLPNYNIPIWEPSKKISNLLIIAEQAIGDQILFYSMLKDLIAFDINITITINAKILSIFQRSFPSISFIERGIDIDVKKFCAYLPMCNLGKIFRSKISDFKKDKEKYLISDPERINLIQSRVSKSKIKCGISWKTHSTFTRTDRSFELKMLEPLLKNKNIEFINLQYGNVEKELNYIKEKFQTDILDTSDIDNFNDIENLAALISSCDIIVTSDSSNAHLAGALGKETYLIIKKNNSLSWYWEHQINNVSQWYKSINIFKQKKAYQWKDPILKINEIIEKKFF
jgi:tetratricopeptide (TPR) repeat protein/ADP-heptose:LPS heptosyltransferase